MVSRRTLSLLATVAVAVLLTGLLQGQAAAKPALVPRPSKAASQVALDAVTDLSVLASATTLAIVLEAVISTGELKPQEPGDPNKLLAIDRWRARSGDDVDSAIWSNVGLYTTVGLAAVDCALASLLDRGDPWYSYAMLYAQSVAITLALTNITKIAVRRPRPLAYHEMQQTGKVSPETNNALSFFSGHAAITAALAGTATYLAFARASNGWEKWVTLAGGVLLTSFVSYQRVDEGKHFPTDVIVGGIVGAAIGVLVPHLHRRRSNGRFYSLYLSPEGQDGALLGLRGTL